ncbi:MAG: hypothetical protein DRO87_05480 [Candidatus Thorarchaeota archaeon]|nr:MAG: hypothetical protein DRO87_05480 [Candidatus Thorarchaeota archaeon]
MVMREPREISPPRPMPDCWFSMTRDFASVEQQVRKKTFGILSTIDKSGRPHSTGILYGVSSPDTHFALYILAGANYVKVRNIRRDPRVSLVVTFPRYYLRFVPASYVMFRGTAEILPFDDHDGRAAFQGSRILRMNLNMDVDSKNLVFIRIRPEPHVVCYGLGIGLMEFRNHPENAGYSVTIPASRL